MPDEIAVMVGRDGQIASLNEDGQIILYQRRGCSCSGYHWHRSRDMNISWQGVQGIRELRERLEKAIEFMGDCRVFITSHVSGVPYFELEKAGFSLWEASGDPGSYLDEVAVQETQGNPEKSHSCEMNDELPAPVEVFPGCFRISLREIQRDNTRFTSKQVLLPFLQRGNYRVLEILCDHVPPWLESGLATGQYSGSIEACGNNMSKITIISCREGDDSPCTEI